MVILIKISTLYLLYYNVSKKVFQWDKKLNEQSVVNSWYNEVKSIFGENGLSEIFKMD